jgi:hypothetical protein
MPKVTFSYRDFWDVPRMIVCKVNGTEVLLDSEFDDSVDEHSSQYKVYILPTELNPDSLKSWTDLPSAAVSYLGTIPVSAIEFDLSRRKEIEIGPLVKLLRSRVPHS